MSELIFIGGDVHPDYTKGLTLGNKYVDLNVGHFRLKKGVCLDIDSTDFCMLVNDYGSRCFYIKSLFRDLKDIRDDKLDILLDYYGC